MKTSEAHTAASDSAVTTEPLFSLGKHTHLHTQRGGRKQLKDVIGQMRIMGLQFGLGLSEYLAAVRQRRAIKAACLSPPAHCAVKLVLSVSLPTTH